MSGITINVADQNEMPQRAWNTEVNISVFRQLATILISEAARLEGSRQEEVDFYDEVRDFECRLIKRALAATDGHQGKAAGMLGLKMTTLNGLIKRYKISTRVAVKRESTSLHSTATSDSRRVVV